MLDPFESTYDNIISEIGIVGYLEKDIIERGSKKNQLPLNLLYSFPKQEINDLILDMMFPDGNHKIQTPKFFVLLLTEIDGSHSYLYCLKFSEKYYNCNNNETIDFYFSSKCEIPCNKNDPDINILFSILDQSIIIKALFTILTEKHIIFVVSQSYLLYLIIGCFIKLIFPFKYLTTCIPVLPKKHLDYLDSPAPYIIGVLSSSISTKELHHGFPEKIIVDCDTN